MAERNYTQIMGSELEWAVSVKVEGEKNSRQLDGMQKLGNIGMFCSEYLQEGIVRVPNSLMGSAGMMSNGSRYYQDVGGHVEYATPENINPTGVVISELAGERIVAESLRLFVANQEKIEAGFLRKRVIDDKMSLWGYHINISEPRHGLYEIERALQPLTIHYASSLPLFGAGAVVTNKEFLRGDEKINYKYSHGQKAVGLSGDFSHGTINGSKPIINMRDEPHAKHHEHRRIHIVGNDPHISPWAARTAIGVYSLLLIACRQKMLPSIEAEGHAYLMAKRATYDIDGTNIYRIVIDGNVKQFRANDIQKTYIERIKDIQDLTDEQKVDLEEWENAVNHLDTNPMNLKYKSDSISKLALIRARLERNNNDPNRLDSGSAGLDKEYTTVLRVTKEQARNQDTKTLMGKTIPSKLRMNWFADDMPLEEEVSGAIIHPPTTTRAYTRGKAILNGSVTDADWSSYSVGDRITRLEPLQGTKRQIK